MKKNCASLRFSTRFCLSAFFLAPLVGILPTAEAQEVTPSEISVPNTSPICFGSEATSEACITLPGDGTVDRVDVFFLFDDTGSFAGFVPTVSGIFSDLVSELQTALPDIEFGFGVGRFEDYGGPGTGFSGEDREGRPFTLNQPIVTVSSAGGNTELVDLINAALSREAPGYGGDGPESAIGEGLYQIATGLGFDGDGDALTTGLDGTQIAGAISSQIASDGSGDVPAFSTLDPAVVSSGTIGGAGFRSKSLKLVVLATDICAIATFDSAAGVPSEVSGLNGTTAPVGDFACSSLEPGSSRFGFVSDSKTEAGNTVAGAVAPAGAATVPATVAALNAAGIRVIGMGPSSEPVPAGSGPSFEPSAFLSALARLTGAVDSDGNPLVFSIGGGGEPLKAGIIEAIVNAVQLPINISLVSDKADSDQPELSITPAVVENVAPGDTACFDVTMSGNGVDTFESTFDLNFVEAGTTSAIASIPVEVDCSVVTVKCEATDVTANQFEMDGGLDRLRNLVRSASSSLRRAGGNRRLAAQLVSSAEAEYVAGWQVVWQEIPSENLSCDATPLCFAVENTPQIEEYRAHSDNLRELVDRAVRATRKARNGRASAGAKLRRRAAKFHEANIERSSSIPATSTNCQAGVQIQKI